MADKSISELTAATQVGSTDLFVLQQANTAKKLTGQILENWLVSLADGHGGIQTVTKTGTSGLVDTYTITYADETTSTFTVTNGKAIASITDYWAASSSKTTEPSSWSTTVPALTTTNKYLWHYSVIAYNVGASTSTAKGVVGVYGDTGLQTYVHIKWSAVANPTASDMGDNPDNYIGIYSGTSSTAPTTPSSYKWFKYKGETGNTGNGIASIAKTGTSGLVDTYTVTFTSGNTTTFNVTNGSNISSIAKTSTSGLVDTYTVTLTNGSTTTFSVTNGKSIVSITLTSGTHAPGTTDTYTITYNDDDTSTFTVYNGANGTGAVSSVDGIDVTDSEGDVELLLLGNGAPTQATAGKYKQRYFDYSNSVLYICMGGSAGQYDWRGAGVTVDSAMSSSSTNPVQNKVIYSALQNKQNASDNSLSTTAKTVVGAINEHETDISGLSTLIGNKANQSDLTALNTFLRAVLPAEYSTSTSYAVGDVCVHDSKLYQCTAATSGTWNSNYWTQVRISNVAVLEYEEV